MSDTNEHLNHEAEKGLPDGLGSENTQHGVDVIHVVEPDSLVYGLGSEDTQSDAGTPGYVGVDHSLDAVDKGLPLGLGADNTQDGPPAPHHSETDSTEHGLGSPDSQHAHE
jgi:hypothetical protein